MAHCTDDDLAKLLEAPNDDAGLQPNDIKQIDDAADHVAGCDSCYTRMEHLRKQREK